MMAYKHRSGHVNTKSHWEEFFDYIDAGTNFEREVAEGRLTPVFLEVNPHKIGKPSAGNIEWTAYARGEDDVDYMIFEYAPLGELAKWTEDSVDFIEEI